MVNDCHFNNDAQCIIRISRDHKVIVCMLWNNEGWMPLEKPRTCHPDQKYSQQIILHDLDQNDSQYVIYVQ